MTPLERAARAIARQDVIDRLGREPSERDIDLLWRGSALKAHAAIQAIREPSDAQVLVYARRYYWDNWGDETAADARALTTAEPVWRDMVDALLAEGDGT